VVRDGPELQKFMKERNVVELGATGSNVFLVSPISACVTCHFSCLCLCLVEYSSWYVYV